MLPALVTIHKSIQTQFIFLLYTAANTVFIEETPTISSSMSVGSILPSQDSYSTAILASSIASGLILLLVLLILFILILIVLSVAGKRMQNKGIVFSVL